MTDDLRILLAADKDDVLNFANAQLAENVSDKMEREMQSWDARWRPEALEHYLPLGWSFGAFREHQLHGFVLGQPLVFFRGLTQTLWIEHIAAQDLDTAARLLDCAVRWARDKHFQSVCAEDTLMALARDWPHSKITDGLMQIKTARL